MTSLDDAAPAGEFILFQSKDGQVRVECRFETDTLWLTQTMLMELYGKSKATISEHISNVFEEGELDPASVVRLFRTTAYDWLSQALIDQLYGATPQAITQHFPAIYDEDKPDAATTCKDYLQVQTERKRQVKRQLSYYNLPVILGTSYRPLSTRSAQPWTCQMLKEPSIGATKS